MNRIGRVAAVLVTVLLFAVPLLLPGCARNPRAAYDALVAHSKELSDTSSLQSLLDWDQEVEMPPGGADGRARMQVIVAGIITDKAKDPRIEGWLAAANRREDWPPVEKGNLREWAREYRMATRLPDSFVEKWTEVTSKAFETWEEARNKNDFSVFAPALEEIVKMAREKADYFGWKESPYDPLLDEYEQGMTAKKYEALFSKLNEEIVPMVKRVVAAQGTRPSVFAGEYPRQAQEAFNRGVSEALGFDFESGRMDSSTHPFTCKITRGDTRITSRYRTDDPMYSLGSQVHETGHGLYEQGLSTDGTPAGEYCSYGVHESQSRLYENMVARSGPFWTYWYPVMASTYGLEAGIADFMKYYNRVEPGLIRTEADEMTYNLHILIRFEIERDMIEGKLAVKDVPEVWKQKYREYLGVEVPDDDSGPLQDVQWASGLIGYFPTYTMGNIYSAQLFDALRKDIPDVDARMAAGEFEPIRQWLAEKIYRWGRVYPPQKLIENASGEPVTIDHFVDYLKAKYER